MFCFQKAKKGHYQIQDTMVISADNLIFDMKTRKAAMLS